MINSAFSFIYASLTSMMDEVIITSDEMMISCPPNMELVIGNLQGFNSNYIHDDHHHQQPLAANFHLDSYNFHMINGSFYDPVVLSPHDDHPSFPNIGTEAIPVINESNYKTSTYVQAAGIGGNKRKRGCENDEKPKEVVHVRAKRGQATDSHSLAERQRREKINEKLRSLQDLVPGCYKTMGMAVMLDVIINYVRSLQNQIEFLSMKLSAASMLLDFNSPEMDTLASMQQQQQGTINSIIGGGGEWSSCGGIPQLPNDLIYPSAPWNGYPL